MFTERENAVLTATIFNMKESKALEWIQKNHGITLTSGQYWKTKIKINSKAEKRKRKFILEGVYKKQIDAIDRLERVIELTFDNYQKAYDEGQYRTAQFILNSISRNQEILTSYYDEIQDIIEYDTDQQKKVDKGAEPFGQEVQDFYGTAERPGSPGSRRFAEN